MRKLIVALLAVAILAPLALPGPQPSAEAQVPDFALPGPVRARFYTQASGVPGLGYAVSNADNVPFLDFFERNGGVAVFGFPITHRHLFRGFTIQAFQKLVVQYQPASNAIAIVNIFDVMSDLGLDPLLEAAFLTPRQEVFVSEANTPRDQAVQNRLNLLNDNLALARAYRASPDPLFFYGLPTARIRDMGGVNVLRTQRAVLQQWLVPRPWAQPGDILVANGGDLAKQIGVFPREAVQPLPSEVVPLSVINLNQPAVAPVFAPVPPAGPPIVPPLFPTPIFIGAVPTPGPTITPTLTVTPRPIPTQNTANCNGDELLTFDPGDPVAGQQFAVTVTSSRPTRNVGLVGPGIVDGPFVFGGGRGTVWQWVVVNGVGGLYGYTFFGNGSACASGQVFVSANAPFPGPPPPLHPPRPTPPLPTIPAVFGASRPGQ